MDDGVFEAGECAGVVPEPRLDLGELERRHVRRLAHALELEAMVRPARWPAGVAPGWAPARVSRNVRFPSSEGDVIGSPIVGQAGRVRPTLPRSSSGNHLSLIEAIAVSITVSPSRRTNCKEVPCTFRSSTSASEESRKGTM